MASIMVGGSESLLGHRLWWEVVSPFQGIDYSLGAVYQMGVIEAALEWHHAVGSTMKTLRSRVGYRF